MLKAAVGVVQVNLLALVGLLAGLYELVRRFISDVLRDLASSLRCLFKGRCSAFNTVVTNMLSANALEAVHGCKFIAIEVLGVAAGEELCGGVLESLAERRADVRPLRASRGLVGHLLSLRVVREPCGACDGVARGLSGLPQAASERGERLCAADGALGSFARCFKSLRSHSCKSLSSTCRHTDVADALNDVSHRELRGSGEEDVRDFLRAGDEHDAENHGEDVHADASERAGVGARGVTIQRR